MPCPVAMWGDHAVCEIPGLHFSSLEDRTARAQGAQDVAPLRTEPRSVLIHPLCQRSRTLLVVHVSVVAGTDAVSSP